MLNITVSSLTDCWHTPGCTRVYQVFLSPVWTSKQTKQSKNFSVQTQEKKTWGLENHDAEQGSAETAKSFFEGI